MKFEIKVISEFTERLDKFLSSKLLDLSRNQVQFLIKNKRVQVNNKLITDCDYKVYSTNDITVEYDASDFMKMSIEAEDISLNIIYEDETIIVLNKPAGVVVHPAPGNYNKTLVNALMHHTNGNLAYNVNNDPMSGLRPGIVHRIDKETSGILVVAKTTLALLSLQKQFEEHDIHRVYYALCFGRPKKISDRIETMIAYNSKTKKQIVHRIFQKKKSRIAITNYEIVDTFDMNDKFVSLIRCKLETGRTHQIRVHMSYIGHPLIGDKLYGNNEQQLKKYDIKCQQFLKSVSRHMLHAAELGFVHPITKQFMSFTSDLPDDMKNLINFCKSYGKTGL